MTDDFEIDMKKSYDYCRGCLHMEVCDRWPSLKCSCVHRMTKKEDTITLEDIKEWCKKRCLVVMTGEYYNKLIGRWSGIAPERKEESNER